MWELFGPLTKGITSVLFTREEVINLDILAKKLQDEKITRWVIVPSLLRALLDKLKSEGLTLPDLRYWTSSGETLSLDLMEEFYRVFPSSSHKLLNIYGSSEVTADVTCYDASEVFNAGNVAETSWYKKGSGSAPIGKPIANNQVYIVDKRGKLLPLGAWGEIYVGGVQVANGYLNATELTAKRFIADDFTKKPGATLFKTGDMARWLRDGNIEYQGRIDGQVKIRGYRIEPGEIENMLKQSDLVNDAIVLAKENNNGNNHLVGYVVPNGAFDKEAVTSYLKSHLPEYMVPAIWVELEKFPLLPNGKLNKKALPQPDVSALLKHQYVAPVTETEVKLAEVWQELLGLEQVGIYDNFFELGGHSILIMKMVSSIKKSFGLTVPIHVVFQLPNINSLSNYIDWEQNVVEDENSTEVEVINI
jgi:acyl-CoA synthetase (AMP-forming)/AMP-acid ligase II/acyl carrier protein